MTNLYATIATLESLATSVYSKDTLLYFIQYFCFGRQHSDSMKNAGKL